jgi:hypothetical protein
MTAAAERPDGHPEPTLVGRSSSHHRYPNHCHPQHTNPTTHFRSSFQVSFWPPRLLPRQTPLHPGCWAWASPVEAGVS